MFPLRAQWHGCEGFATARVNPLEEKVKAIAATIHYEDFEDLEEKTKHIRELIASVPMPPEIEAEIEKHYGCQQDIEWA